MCVRACGDDANDVGDRAQLTMVTELGLGDPSGLRLWSRAGEEGERLRITFGRDEASNIVASCTN